MPCSRSSLIGLLVVILGLLQLVLIAAALYGFNQEWHVEEERPIGSGEDYGAGAAPERQRPRSPPERPLELMPEVGLEPTRPFRRLILNQSRIPIPPLRRGGNDSPAARRTSGISDG